MIGEFKKDIIELTLPTQRNPTANPACQLTASQILPPPSLPNSATIKEIVFAGRTHPKYPEICARQVATRVPRNCGER